MSQPRDLDDAERRSLDDVDPSPQPDPVDEGPPGDRRPVRGPTWAHAYREALGDDDGETSDGAASLRITEQEARKEATSVELSSGESDAT
jgi:hypothetical protein